MSSQNKDDLREAFDDALDADEMLRAYRQAKQEPAGFFIRSSEFGPRVEVEAGTNGAIKLYVEPVQHAGAQQSKGEKGST